MAYFVKYQKLCLSIVLGYLAIYSQSNVYAQSVASTQSKTYVSKNSTSQLNPFNTKDAKVLGESIEFEVYEIGENHQSHTTFEAGSGICRGYKELGVEVTDSTTVYVRKAEGDYYASIVGGTVTDNDHPQNVQYARIFNIADNQLAKNVQTEVSKTGKQGAVDTIKIRAGVLKNLCINKN